MTLMSVLVEAHVLPQTFVLHVPLDGKEAVVRFLFVMVSQLMTPQMSVVDVVHVLVVINVHLAQVVMVDHIANYQFATVNSQTTQSMFAPVAVFVLRQMCAQSVTLVTLVPIANIQSVIQFQQILPRFVHNVELVSLQTTVLVKMVMQETNAKILHSHRLLIIYVLV